MDSTPDSCECEAGVGRGKSDEESLGLDIQRIKYFLKVQVEMVSETDKVFIPVFRVADYFPGDNQRADGGW